VWPWACRRPTNAPRGCPVSLTAGPVDFPGEPCRGAKAKDRLRAGDEQMRLIRDAVTRNADGNLDLAFIRFPNDDMPLGGCDAGRIIYVFADGDVAVCPYLVFAARNAESRPCRRGSCPRSASSRDSGGHRCTLGSFGLLSLPVLAGEQLRLLVLRSLRTAP
jgi:hypothetical protein